MEIDGIDEETAEKIRDVIDFSEKLYTKQAREKAKKLDRPKAVYEYAKTKLSHKEQEHFLVMILDKLYNLLDEEIISKGSGTHTTCEPKDVFRKAIRIGGNKIILVHNHPSGDVEPSKNDILTTRRLAKIGLFLNIDIVDHVIVGNGEYLSMVDEGYLNTKKIMEENQDIKF